MDRIARLAGLLALLGLAAATPTVALAASPDQVNEIASQLVCQCGCGLVLNNCNHEHCEPRDSMLAYIGQALDQGKTRDAIIASLVESYGEVVLAAPTKRGFNLVGWITPFAAIAAGGGIVYLAVRAWLVWGKRTREEAVELAADDPYLSRVDDELRRYEERMG
ncbi:MAG: cytochrome c-type biogenesis protein CcmH [Chloroflexi bacterium]|nr:cytochrome c-type biogenesis protein CcmH [Chloroflexota bacterium]